MGRNVVLIGMPGTGKSVAGRLLASQMGLAFVDLDDVITARRGMTLPEILRREGLAAFCALGSFVFVFPYRGVNCFLALVKQALLAVGLGGLGVLRRRSQP